MIGNKSILITGVAGSGKSTICEELRKLSFRSYDFEAIDDYCRMVDKETGLAIKNFDADDPDSVKQAIWICDKNKLQGLVNNNPTGIVFYCGTASNIEELLPLFDKVLLLKVGEEELRRRLSRRPSPEFGRSPEIQDWIISGKVCWEKQVSDNGAIVIDTNGNLKQVITKIVDICK